MINYLLELGIEAKDIKNILEYNKDLVDYDDYIKNVELLKLLNCDEKEIRNIIITNPNFLIRSNLDVLKLVEEFIKFGFLNLNILFDSNPYLLSKDVFELRDYINEKKASGLTIHDIISYLEENPNDFN